MIRNVHERDLPVASERLAPLFDGVAEPGNPVWPAPAWPALRLDRPLGVGAVGGHGPIRYACTGHARAARWSSPSIRASDWWARTP